MKRILSFLLSIVIAFGIITSVDLSVWAADTSSLEKNFSEVSYTDVFYGYTVYLMNYNDIMRKPITSSIVEAGEQFGIDDKFLATLETTLDTVGSFSKTFYTLTDAIGITSKLTDAAADKAISSVLKSIYEDEDSEFWSVIINKESESVKALKDSLNFIDNYTLAEFENYTLNEIYGELLEKSIEETCKYNVAIGELNLTQKTSITDTFYEYYKGYIKDWEYIVKLTKCINTILFYQNVEIELIDYILKFDDLDEDLVKGLKRIKSSIKSNYATYLIETVTKEVIDTILSEIGGLLGYKTPIASVIGIAFKFASWLIFDKIYQHADAEDYLAYIYLLKFTYSAQDEMNKKLNFFNTDLVYSDTIDDFEYFYKIYSSIFKSSKGYAEKLSGKSIDFVYQDEFFECEAFIDYVRNEIEKINVEDRIEKTTLLNKTYKFDKPVVLSDEKKESTCLVTFHDRLFAPIVIDDNIEYDNCDLIVPELTINCSLTIEKKIVVEGNYYSGSKASGKININENGVLEVFGNANLSGTGHGYQVDTTSYLYVRKGGAFKVKNDLILNGYYTIGSGLNCVNLIVYGDLTVGGNLKSNSLANIDIYGLAIVLGNADFVAASCFTYVSRSCIRIYENATFNILGDLKLKGVAYYNTGNNWFSLYIYGKLYVNGNFSATNRFVSFDQYGSNSFWQVNGDFYADVLNESTIWGFDISTCQGYTCNLKAGELVIGGNYKKGGGVTISPTGTHKIILNGDNIQNINGINANTLIIENEKGVCFSSVINVTTLFNHNRNSFTLYNNGNGSSFPDYDGDGYKDNVDPYPLEKHPAEHNYVFTKTVVPTCVLQGYDLYTCLYCNCTEKQNLVATLPHNYSFTKTVAPTCTAQGYDVYTCSNCGGTEKRNTVSATGHSYSFTKTVAPTCTAQGYDLYTCSNCNGTEKRNAVSATGHNYEEKSNTVTCTQDGIKTSVCSKCGDTKTESVSALGHSYDKVYVAPTCTESNGYTNTCKHCGDVTHDFYPARGHDYGELAGKAYVDIIEDSTISTTANYNSEYYRTSSKIGASLSSQNIAVPYEIRLNITDLSAVTAYRFGVKNTLFTNKNACKCIFAYDANTGREAEKSAIPYTDEDGNLVNMLYVDYMTDGEWVSGQYTLEDNKIVDLYGDVVCESFTKTRPHIVYTKSEALEKGIMNSDGTVDVTSNTLEPSDISFSAGVPGIYFTASNISASSIRKFKKVFGYDENCEEKVNGGKYDVKLCFYNEKKSALSETMFKIYDGSLIKKVSETLTGEERIEYTCMDCGETHSVAVPEITAVSAVTIDSKNKLVCTLPQKTQSIEGYVDVAEDGFRVEAVGEFCYLGTNTALNLLSGITVCDTYRVVVMGDLNGDGVVDVLDCVLIERICSGHYAFDDTNDEADAFRLASDANCDGEITVADYSEIVNTALGA